MKRAAPTIRTAAALLGTWVPALLLIFIIAPAGIAKFSDTSGWAAAFRHWGYPDWFRISIGVLEVVGAACLLWGRTAPVGATMICVVMLGGTETHLAFDHGRHVTSEVVPIVFSAIVLFARRREAKALVATARRGFVRGRSRSTFVADG